MTTLDLGLMIDVASKVPTEFDFNCTQTNVRDRTWRQLGATLNFDFRHMLWAKLYRNITHPAVLNGYTGPLRDALCPP